jgi:DNA primase
MADRIVIPICNRQGQIVAYAGRAINEQLPKYKLPKGFRKGRELFNVHRAAATAMPTAIVVEGYFDCMRVHQAGLPNVVALMGSSLSAHQEELLLKHFQRVLLFLDGDQAGRQGSDVIARRLASRCIVQPILLPNGVQPDHLPPAEIRQLCNHF